MVYRNCYFVVSSLFTHVLNFVAVLVIEIDVVLVNSLS